jgi:hypothetical protein
MDAADRQQIRIDRQPMEAMLPPQADYWTRKCGVSWEQLSKAVCAVSNQRAKVPMPAFPELDGGGRRAQL